MTERIHALDALRGFALLGIILGNVTWFSGYAVASLHLRHMWPLPHGLDAIFSRYACILVPELNMGQAVRLLRSEYAGHNFVSFPKVQGRPFAVQEVYEKIASLPEK